MTYLFGDLHGDVGPLINKIIELSNQKIAESVFFIILGDSGINYYLDYRDVLLKMQLENEIKKSGINLKIVLVRGNHDVIPSKITTYEIKEAFGGKVFIEADYPDLIFLAEGDVYRIENRNYIVFSGGRSRDWFQRILRGEFWEPDEEISDIQFNEILSLYDRKIEKDMKYCLLGHQLPSSLLAESDTFCRTEENLQIIFEKYEDCITEVHSGHYHKNIKWTNGNKTICIHYK